METMTVTLNAEDTAFVKRVVSLGEYATVDDFLSEMMVYARKKRWVTYVEGKIEEGLASESIEMTPEMWDELLEEHDREFPETSS